MSAAKELPLYQNSNRIVTRKMGYSVPKGTKFKQRSGLSKSACFGIYSSSQSIYLEIVVLPLPAASGEVVLMLASVRDNEVQCEYKQKVWIWKLT